MTQNELAPTEEAEAPLGNLARFPNEVIRASAGTGKTFQLSNRYIALAGASERPEEILAATFARKAAGEILDRVVIRLAEAADDSAKLTELAGFLQTQSGDADFDRTTCLGLLSTLIQNLHRLRISTLDSFFVQIAGSFGLELGLPPGWTIVDEVIDQRHRSLAIQKVLAEGSATDLLTLLHLLNKGDVSRVVSEQIRRTANELYHLYRETTPENADSEIPKVWRSIKRFKPLNEQEWEEALSDLAMLEFPGQKQFQKAWERDLEAARDGDWEKLAGGGFVKVLLSGANTYYRKPVPPEVIAVYKPILEHLKSQLVNRFADQTESTWKLLDQFHKAYQQFKNEQRAFRFQDITQVLATAIGDMDAGQLAFRLDSHVGHLLLDEFQDTSLLQWSVIRPFAEAAAREPNRSFFCVGDVKQAIYGWRGGVADLFAQLDDQLPSLSERELTRSYRSSPVVIDVVNKVFGGLDSNEIARKLTGVSETWKSRFQTHSTARDFPGYCVLQTAERAKEGEDQQVATLQYAAAEVARLHRESPGASIGILVRKNRAVARMIYELRNHHGIEASEEGGNPLLDSAGVQIILSLLAIADHPGDTIARYHVAHSPLDEVVGLTDFADETSARQVSSKIRNSLLQAGYGATISRWVRALTFHCNERELARLMQLVNLAYRYEAQATQQAEDFIAMVSATRVEDPSAASVRVMNIHQSKGLQFDIVVLPELDGRLSGLTPSVIVGRKSATSPVEAVFRYISKDALRLLPPWFAQMLEEHNHQIDNESLCLLYVAMTRAIHALHMIVAPSKENERSLPKTHAGLLRAGLTETGSQVPPGEILYEHGEASWFARDADDLETEPPEPPTPSPIEVRFRTRKKERSRRLERRSPSALEGGNLADLQGCFRQDSVLTRTRGQLWHAWLEQVDWLDDDAKSGLPTDERLKQLAGQFLHPRLKLDDEITQFKKALSQPEIRESLSRRQYDAGQELRLEQEYPIAYRKDEVLTHGFLDRLVLQSRNNQPVGADIIDFKLGRLSGDDPEALTKVGEFYEPQLKAYREAIGHVFSLDQNVIQVRCVFLKAGRIWTLPRDGT